MDGLQGQNPMVLHSFYHQAYAKKSVPFSRVSNLLPNLSTIGYTNISTNIDVENQPSPDF